MKNYLVIALFCILMCGCGYVESTYESCNYESLTNEKCDIELMSGGQIMETYKNAEIIYSDSDNLAFWYRTSEGELFYYQGYARMKMLSE